jgi:hypothetical protein
MAFSKVLARPRFYSWPGHVSLGTSRNDSGQVSLYSGDPGHDSQHSEHARRQLGNKPSPLQVLFGLYPSAVHVCSCMFM